jgi:hypothetical protein
MIGGMENPQPSENRQKLSKKNFTEAERANIREAERIANQPPKKKAGKSRGRC